MTLDKITHDGLIELGFKKESDVLCRWRRMLKAIKLFLLKRKIGYRYRKIGYRYRWGSENHCRRCIAYTNGEMSAFCDRYKLAVYCEDVCNHFVPKQISEKDRAEIEKVGNHILSIYNWLNGMVSKLGGAK